VITKPLEGRRRLRIRKDRLRQLGRRKFGTTTDGALATHLGFDHSNLSNLLNGKTEPSTRTVIYLLDLFEVELDDLFERYSPPPRRDPAAVTPAA
jgi:transcriptional regulator with XRE-family HTH domain